jgi:carboxyl-terminal processing protease
MLPGTPIAHVAIQEFGSEADRQLRAAIRAARAKGAKGLLLDVRGNPGGLKDQAVAVTSQFLTSGNVFLERDAQGRETAVPVEPGGIAPDIPVCVLIDEGTASSAEIFAGALQDHGRAKLVGTHTFGTGTVLKPFLLSDGSAVLLAVLEWLTPNGRLIWHHGIKPDVEVALSNGTPILLPYEETHMDAAALKRSPDKQLLTALHLLREKVENSARGE